MADPRVEKLADLLVNYCVEVRQGDWVLVRGHVLAQPLVEQVVKHIALAGGNPTVLLESDEMDEMLLQSASEDQLRWASPLDEVMARGLDARIVIRAATNTRAFTNIDPLRQQLFQNARRKYMPIFRQRAAEGVHRWVLTNFPCPAYAQDADMSLREFEDFVYAATYADQADPVAAWQQVYDSQQRWVDWLTGKDRIVVRGPNVDLTLSVKGRSWVNSDGKRNMPSGEIFTGPVENSVNGWVRFTYPAVRDGLVVEGVEFEFKEGKVVAARAAKNEEYLLKQLASDEGACYLGEFAIGTNYQIQRFTKSILYDEKIGGTFHLALGAGYPETGSQNHSAIHWDFICDMRRDSEIVVDGTLLYKNGQFQV